MEEKSGLSQLQREISKINWNQVYYFSLVASFGSIKKAADLLNLSPSTLSEHISQLESSLDIALFHRHGPKLSLTEAGHKLSWQAKHMFESGQQILETASQQSLESYPIGIGIVPGPQLPLAHQFIASYTKEFGTSHMKVRQCNFEELENQLVKGKLDFGFADQASKRKDILSHRLLTSPIRFYVSHQWSKFSLREVLREIPLLICQSEASTDAFLQKALSDVDIQPCAVIEADYPGVLLDLCRQGLGAGAFCEGSFSENTSAQLHSLTHPKDAPRIESQTFLLWAANGAETSAVQHAKSLMIK